MISKNHRQNSNFQILHFLVGSCHTPDAAYSLCLDLKEEREMAIEYYYVSELRQKEKTELMPSDRLEMEYNAKRAKVLYQAAMDEICFIDECIEKLQPQRKYAHLSDAESNQMMQREEWKLELIKRAENYLLTCGTIPADHFDTMRMHPDFINEILPQINNIRIAVQTETGYKKLLSNNRKLIGG